MSKFKYYLEEGCEFVDTKFSTYNKGTQLMLEILDEQDCEYESTIQYESLVDDLEVHIAWMDLMYPRPEKSPYLPY